MGLDEAWVHTQIKQDPSILGLGKVALKDSERRQAKAGRLDLLLSDTGTEPERRFELEVQLGATDESHIVRTIEYWDLERRVLPKYEHVAVIAAEDITSRFFNVIHLFNRAIPIIALKMVALQVEGGLLLHFVKVLDETAYRIDDEENSSPADKSYWEKAASPESMVIVDILFKILKEVKGDLTPHYTQSYIVPELGGRNWNFLSLNPKQRFVRSWVLLPDEETAKEWLARLTAGGLSAQTSLDPEEAWIDIKLTLEGAKQGEELLKELLKAAYEAYRR